MMAQDDRAPSLNSSFIDVYAPLRVWLCVVVVVAVRLAADDSSLSDNKQGLTGQPLSVTPPSLPLASCAIALIFVRGLRGFVSCP